MASRKDLLKQARARFKMGQEAELEQRKMELDDLRFYNGEQWDKDLLDSRKGMSIGSGAGSQIVPARPSLTINKTREPVRQVLNQERQSEMGVELVPADDWGGMTGEIDHSEIELREGIIRRIQRDSEAADARTWAFSRAVQGGRGYSLVNTRYVPGKTWDQEVYINRIYNQSAAMLDPAHEQPDGSDARWGFIWADVPYDQYKAEYGTRNGKKNRLADNISDNEWRTLGDEQPDWFQTAKSGKDEEGTRMVRVGDYYYEELTSKSLCLLESGEAVWKDELPEGFPADQIKETREVIDRQIKWCKIDGCDDDVLDETEWPGHYIPIIKVVGEELQPTGKDRVCEGIVRSMKDSCRGFNYSVSKFVERFGLTSIPPIMMAEGQDEGFEEEYDALNTRALSRVHYRQVDLDGRPAPPPFKPPSASAEVGDVGMGLQLFNDAIVSTSRVPETALGHVDPSVKSGKLANALIQQAEQGTSNYLDNLRRSMRHEARVVNDLLYPIYGRPGRLARMMNPSGKMTSVIIGQPFTVPPAPQQPGPNGQAPGGQQAQARPVPVQGWQPGQPIPPGAQFIGLTKDAEFNVAVKIAKNTDTRRQQFVDTVGQIVGADPSQMQVIGDLLWKNMDAPDHEEIAKRYRAILAPPVQAAISGQPQIPPEVQQQLQQAQQAIQQLTQLADKNKTDLAKAQMQGQVDLQSKQMEIASREKIALIQASTTMNVAQGKIDAEDARTFVDAVENRVAGLLELHMAKLGQVHAALQQQHDTAHDVALTAMQHSHEQNLADQAHQQALEQGQQGADIASQQMAQQAALTPANGDQA
jgi:hypothetical protein